MNPNLAVSDGLDLPYQSAGLAVDMGEHGWSGLELGKCKLTYFDVGAHHVIYVRLGRTSIKGEEGWRGRYFNMLAWFNSGSIDSMNTIKAESIPFRRAQGFGWVQR